MRLIEAPWRRSERRNSAPERCGRREIRRRKSPRGRSPLMTPPAMVTFPYAAHRQDQNFTEPLKLENDEFIQDKCSSNMWQDQIRVDEYVGNAARNNTTTSASVQSSSNEEMNTKDPLPSTAQTSRQRKKKRVELTDCIMKVAELLTARNERKKAEDIYSIDACYAIMNEYMEDYGEKVILRAMEKLQNAQTRNFFVLMNDKLRRAWFNDLSN